MEKNIGYGYGIMSGLRSAKGEFLAFSHADMQCDPKDVFRAFELLRKQENSERVLVKGNRKGRQNFLTSGLHMLARALFLRRFDDINGQPKIFDKGLMHTFKNPPNGFQLDFYLQYKALKSGYRVVSFPVAFGQRKFGYSKWATSLKSRIKNVSRFLGYMLKVRLLGE